MNTNKKILELEKQSAYLTALNRFAVDIMSITTKDELAWHVSKHVIGEAGFVDCAVYFLDESGEYLHQISVLGAKEAGEGEILNKPVIPVGQGIAGRVMKSAQAEIVDDLSTDPDYIADLEPALSEICVPIIVDGKAAGVIDCKHAEKSYFKATHLERLTTVASMAAARFFLIETSEEERRRADEFAELNQRLQNEMEKREQVEKKLRVAETLEAVGQLSGGIAHDFNNLLSIILSNAELLGSEIGDDNAFLKTIIETCQNGSDLAKRLLIFARRQPMKKEAVGVDDYIFQELYPLLKRTLGPQIGIDIKLGAEGGVVYVDPSQLHNAFLNLALNARDAMPEGGVLKIKTKIKKLEAQAKRKKLGGLEGEFIVVSVSDNGAGIDDKIMGKVFEPFFTTKEEGMGSGLGLSMVYGFSKQSGGATIISRNKDRGVTVELYIPVMNMVVKKKENDKFLPPKRGNKEKILILEDDNVLLNSFAKMLELLNYEVIKANNLLKAKKMLKRHSDIRLVISDVMLGHDQNGIDFSRQIKSNMPHIPFILISGYFTDGSLKNQKLKDDEIFISKPFSMGKLSAVILEEMAKATPS